MTTKIISKPSNSGKRTVYFPTVDGLRISRTNFARRWEAKRLLKAFIAYRAEKAA